MPTLSERLKFVIEAEVRERGRFALLAEKSRVPAETWRSWWNRGGVPSGALVEAVACIWPQYAFWLATGGTDVRCGHIAPVHSFSETTNVDATETALPMKTDFSVAYLNQLQVSPQNCDEAETPQGAMAIATLNALSAHRAAEIAFNFNNHS